MPAILCNKELNVLKMPARQLVYYKRIYRKCLEGFLHFAHTHSLLQHVLFLSHPATLKVQLFIKLKSPQNSFEQLLLF